MKDAKMMTDSGAAPTPPLEGRAVHLVSVIAFGAVGDGETDDARAFQAALAAIGDDGQPAKLVTPAGTYFLGRSLVLATPER